MALQDFSWVEIRGLEAPFTVAQGNRPGNLMPVLRALKGHLSLGFGKRFEEALQASNGRHPPTQGGALGYDDTGALPREPSKPTEFPVVPKWCCRIFSGG